MAIKDLLVYVDNDEQCANRLQFAVQMATHCEARLSGVYVRRQLEIPSYADVQIPQDVLAAGEKQLMEMSGAARNTFQKGVEGSSLDSEFHQLKGVLPEVLSTSMHYADLAIVAQRHPGQGDLNVHYSPEPLLFQAGRPLVIVPHTGEFTYSSGKVVVAWNTSAPSARALHDALPLLRHAAQVLVVSVGKSQQAALADGSLARHLTQHGLQVEYRNFDAADSEAPEAVLSVAGETGSELIVMGGYGHTRFRELVLGGMTRALLESMTVPVLMSH
ncbi:MAG: universal stress protein [Gammaproteobacteria bacterium]|nr:universal stress protein [Gammaproteobacteria bacterium]